MDDGLQAARMLDGVANGHKCPDRLDRSMPRLASILFLAAFAVSGCLAEHRQPPAPTLEPPAPAPMESDLAWELTDCAYANWIIPADRAALQGHLPAGFEPEPLGLVPGSDQAFVGVLAMDCAPANGSSERTSFGSIFTGVRAPGQFPAPAGGQYWRFASLDSDADFRSELTGRGIPVEDGMTRAAATPGGQASTWEAMLHLDSQGHLAMTGIAVTPPGTPSAVSFREFSNSTHGLAVWNATATSTAVYTGQGIWSSDAGSFVEQVTGLRQGAASFTAGTWSIKGSIASVHWPAGHVH
jgi:hypothetical protein